MIKIETRLYDHKAKPASRGIFPVDTAIAEVTVKLFGKIVWSKSERKIITTPMPSHPMCRCVAIPDSLPSFWANRFESIRAEKAKEGAQ